MANQSGDQCRTAIPHLVQRNEHRVTAGEGSGRLAHHGQKLGDQPGQRCVVLGQPEDLVGQPGRRAVHPGVQTRWPLGYLDMLSRAAETP